MRSAILRSFAVLVVLLLAFGANAAAFQADPARWGVYAKLVGFEYKGVQGSWKRTKNWRWSADGTSLIEEDVGYEPTTIRQGVNPGELVLSYNNTTFDGKIASDGSVLWIRRGTIKLPYRVVLEGGELREEKVKLVGTEIASVKSVFRYSQTGKLAGIAPQAGPEVSPGTVAIAAEASATAAAGQSQTVIDIDAGQTITQKMGGTSELYRFVGVAGTRVTASLTAPGDIALVYYTPEGEEMISTRSSGNASLDLTLPFADVYFLGVLRQDASRPYDLKLAAVSPDDHLHEFASFVGYDLLSDNPGDPPVRTSCWLEPGVKKKVVEKKRTWESTLGRAGLETKVSRNPQAPGSTSVEETRLSFSDTTATRTWTDGRKPAESYERDVPARSQYTKFRRYLCE